MPISFLALALVPLLQVPDSPAHDDPARDRTLPPPAARQVARVLGKGVQIYACSAQGSGMAWTLQAPEAVLTRASDNMQVGTHGAGPRWTWTDGSAIGGNVVASQPAPQPGDLPSLLVETFSSSVINGFLSNVIWVRRSDTSGGVPPTSPCDPAHVHALVRVPYAATYTFYAGSPVQ